MSGPPPLNRPSFPAEFLDRAQPLALRRTAPSHLRQRARLVWLLHEQPRLSNVAAGARIDLHPNSVRLWRRPWAEGQFALEDRPGRGRNATSSPPRSISGRGTRL